MGLPKITISFKDRAKTAIQRSERGVVGLILVDSNAPTKNPFVVTGIDDIPSSLSAANVEQIKLAMIGFEQTVKKIYVYVTDSIANVTDGLDAFLLTNVSYVAVPEITDEVATEAVTWLKTNRVDTEACIIKLVLPNKTADHEAVVNFTADEIVNDELNKTFTTAQYCGRIAGILATTPLTQSCTYHTLPEVSSVKKLSKKELDDAVDAGELVAFFDGEKVKLGRGVNSLTTLGTKTEQWKKIRVVDVMDIMRADIKRTIQDNYIGKIVNIYDNKSRLCDAINGYFDTLITEGALSRGYSEVDVDANKKWLKEASYDVADMSDEDILKADTGDDVMIKASVSILDVMEDITLNIQV